VSFIRRALAGESQRYGATSGGNPWAIPSNGDLGSGGPAGVAVNQTSAMQQMAVWACVRIISGTVSTLPMEAVVDNRIVAAPQIVADPFGGLNSLNQRLLSRKAGMAQVMVSLLLRGNAYLMVSEWWDKRPALLTILSPDQVTVAWGTEADTLEYRVNGRVVDPTQIVHIRGMTLPGDFVGMSVIEYARRTIGLGLAAEEFGAKFFARGATLGGVLEVPGDLDETKARRLKATFSAAHSGLQNAHAIGVLTGGAKYSPVSVSPEDAQFLGTRAAQNIDVAMMFGVPPHMLGQVDRTTSWGKGIEEQTLGFLKYTLSDWTTRIEDVWSAMVPEPVTTRFNYDALLRPDTTARYTAYQTARNAAFMTINEIREKEGLLPVPEGDDITAPLNSAHTNDPGFQLGDDTSPPEPAPGDTAPPA
jgi:HK97 family phage portal protein